MQDDQGRKLTTQALADRTAELGYPLDRSVIAKLEKGHRQTITVPDVLVLAQALEVPPLLLLLPLGEADRFEVRPGSEVPTVDALQWLTGKMPLPGQQWADDRSNVVANFEAHQQSIDWWALQNRSAQMVREGILPGGEAVAERHDQDAERTVVQLRTLRALLRERGLTPPPLSPELAHRVEGVRES